MQIGFNAPIAGPLSAPENLIRICVGGEAIGFHYAAFSDHIVIPTDIQARYPYSETGEFPTGARTARHEQLTTIAFIAAKTSRLYPRHLGDGGAAPPGGADGEDPLDDRRAVGRAPGRGHRAGWLKEEFEAVGTPPFPARGAVTDEYLQAFRALWTEEEPRFAGEHVSFGGIVFDPKPVQKPRLPIWVGGESGPALRRTARLGDAWYPDRHQPVASARQPGALPRRRGPAAQGCRGCRARPGGHPAGLSLRPTWHEPAGAGRGRRAPAVFGQRSRYRGGPAGSAGPRRHPCGFQLRRPDGRGGLGGHAGFPRRGCREDLTD